MRCSRRSRTLDSRRWKSRGYLFCRLLWATCAVEMSSANAIMSCYLKSVVSWRDCGMKAVRAGHTPSLQESLLFKLRKVGRSSLGSSCYEQKLARTDDECPADPGASDRLSRCRLVRRP